ncbi:MAG: RHS repeat protein [Gemmatimonadetes bacterium]|nr:RHS repeat protein [Gemmatimonadota bacterium]
MSTTGTTSRPWVRATFTATDDQHLDPASSSIWVKINGSVYGGVYWSFEWSASGERLAALATVDSVPLAVGANTIMLHACDIEGLCDSTSAVVTYTPPPKLTLDLTTSHDNDHRPASPCPGCIAEFAYAAPAYVSMDAPRTLEIRYSSAEAAPRAFVQMDAVSPVSQSGNTYLLKLRLLSGSTPVALAVPGNSSGVTELYFTPHPYGVTRLAAQLNDTTLQTGSYLLTAEVTRYVNGSQDTVATVAMRAMVLNRIRSRLGRGVSWAGIPEIFIVDGGDAMLAPGDGTLWHFPRTSYSNGNATYWTPLGLFVRLTSAGFAFKLETGDSTVVQFGGTQSPSFADYNLMSSKPTSVTDRFGNQVTFTYNANGTLWKVTSPDGAYMGASYGTSPDSNLYSIWDSPGGRNSYFSYNANRLAAIQAPDGTLPLSSVAYDGAARMTSGVDALGATSWRTFGSNGWISSSTPALATDSVRPFLDTVLVTAGKGSLLLPAAGVAPSSATTRQKLSNGTSTSTVVDAYGLPLRVDVRNPLGRTLTTTYQRLATGQLASITDPSLTTTTFTYGGELLLSKTVGGELWTWQYGPYNQVSYASHAADVPSYSYYSGAKATLDSVKTGQLVTRFQWDTRGRNTWTQAPNGAITTRTYQTTGLLNTASVTTPVSNSYSSGITQLAYDAMGRDTMVTDASGAKVRKAYDVLNQVRRVTSPANDSVTVARNVSSRTVVITDERGLKDSTIMDPFGRDTVHVHPGGGRTRKAYDVYGNLATVTNRRGQTISFVYDSLFRLRSRITMTVPPPFPPVSA